MGTMSVTACTPQQKLTVVTDILKFVPVVTNVADAVCGFTPSATICTGAVTAVSASAAILDTALVNYFTAEANGTVPPGIIAALQQAITTFENDAANILGAVRVLDPVLQAEIQTIVAAASFLLGVIETLFPTLAVAGVKLKFGATPSPAGFTLGSFVTDYNKKVAVCQTYVPSNVKLQRVHVHSLVLRIATLGLAK